MIQLFKLIYTLKRPLLLLFLSIIAIQLIQCKRSPKRRPLVVAVCGW
ncbi:hypothetical protein [Spirosoma flavum]|uniref:Uncharacterized protein n=1 Tax=Spirosoma flavum TaxID=2048557 RepID=A0ABW6ALF3_9BACT